MKNSLIKFSFVSIIIFLTACSNDNPQRVSTRYWDAVMSGDYNTLKKITTENSKNIVETIDTPGKGSYFTVDETLLIDNNHAQVTTTLVLAENDDHNTHHIKTYLKKEDDEWKVDVRKTRSALASSILSQTFSKIGDSFEDSADALHDLGEQVADEVNQKIIEASQELQKQSEQASQDLQQALDDLKKDLQKNKR